LAIMRLWHGKVPIGKADEYEKFLIERAVTIWDSMESIKKFAGENPELAKYYPEDDEFLLEKEKYVSMYRVFYEK